MDHAQRIGGAIKDAREKHGYTQQEVAEATGLSQPTISVIEKGNFCTIPNSAMMLLDEMGLTTTLVVAGNGKNKRISL